MGCETPTERGWKGEPRVKRAVLHPAPAFSIELPYSVINSDAHSNSPLPWNPFPRYPSVYLHHRVPHQHARRISCQGLRIPFAALNPAIDPSSPRSHHQLASVAGIMCSTDYCPTSELPRPTRQHDTGRVRHPPEEHQPPSSRPATCTLCFSSVLVRDNSTQLFPQVPKTKSCLQGQHANNVGDLKNSPASSPFPRQQPPSNLAPPHQPP